MMWQPARTLPEKGDDVRFHVYLAFDNRTVRLADWVSFTHYSSEYHNTGAYLGQYPSDGDSYYMTDDGYDVRKSEDGSWETYSHHDDGRKERHVVTGWMEALRPAPEWADVA